MSSQNLNQKIKSIPTTSSSISSNKIPSDWVETTLGEVCEVQNGYAFKADEFSDRGIYVIKIKNIASGEFILNDIGLYNGDTSKLANYFVKKGDILVSMTGSHISQISSAVGKVCVYNLDEKALLNQRIGNIKPKQNIDKTYLRCLLIQPEVQLFWGAKAGGSANQANISPSIIKSYSFLLPPLPEQLVIASVLSAFDDKIELLREQNKILEEMGQVIFQEWFGKYGVDDELPEWWRVGKLGEVVDLLNGFAYKSSDFIENGKYRLVTIANVQDGSFVENTKDGLNEIPQKMPDYCNLKTGDILLSLTGNVGRICHVVGKNYFLNQRVAKLQAKEKQDYGFIYTMFRQNSMIGLLESISAGTAQQNLSPIKTAELEIVIPSREILNNFANIINPMTDKMLDNKLQIQSLARSRDELLPRLMSGEVRVI